MSPATAGHARPSSTATSLVCTRTGGARVRPTASSCSRMAAPNISDRRLRYTGTMANCSPLSLSARKTMNILSATIDHASEISLVINFASRKEVYADYNHVRHAQGKAISFGVHFDELYVTTNRSPVRGHSRLYRPARRGPTCLCRHQSLQTVAYRPSAL